MYDHGQAPLLYQNYVSDLHPMSLDTVGQSMQCITPSGARTDNKMSCHVIENNFSCVQDWFFFNFVFRKRDLLENSFCWNNRNKGRNIHSKYFQQIIKEPDIGICSLKATQLLLKRKKLIWCCLAEIGGGHDLLGQERLQPPSPSCPVYPNCTQPLCTYRTHLVPLLYLSCTHLVPILCPFCTFRNAIQRLDRRGCSLQAETRLVLSTFVYPQRTLLLCTIPALSAKLSFSYSCNTTPW